jgi:hypothetical protein
MDARAILLGKGLRKRADLDWLAFENQSGEWSVRSCEAFERHLDKLSQWGGEAEGFWYGYPERRLLK